MKIEWMGKYREFVATLFRSGNAYAQIVKQTTVGNKVKFGPYEVQIMEHILEYGDKNKNMVWYARQLGMLPSTFSKYVKKLVEKGLVEKYHLSDNKKNIILKLSELGIEEYELYSKTAYELWFRDFFRLLDNLSEEQLQQTQEIIALWGNWCTNLTQKKEAELIKID